MNKYPKRTKPKDNHPWKNPMFIQRKKFLLPGEQDFIEVKRERVIYSSKLNKRRK